ncbi:hypothetical protein [Nostoc sp. KVJ20]|uniref:hypothetical protein n=1 Tax=Nostoc sp. KVJ20 TaxID=457944 RepID=UPI00159F1915|nr:hypothetical protein [Nostoc sp. KVJ20]
MNKKWVNLIKVNSLNSDSPLILNPFIQTRLENTHLPPTLSASRIENIAVSG